LNDLITQAGDSAQVIKRWPLLVPGARVEAIAQKLGFNQVICAVNASDEIMTQTAIEWWEQRGES
jgi:uroporphyrinogen-III synthase